MLRFAIRNSQFAILKKFAFLCLVILLTISPATIRNYLVSGKFVLISTNGPVNLWIGNNPYAEGDFYYPPSFYAKKIMDLVGKEGDRAYVKEVIRFFKEDTERFLRLILKKLLLFLSHIEIENNINFSIQKSYSSLFKIPAFVGFGLVGSLALVGIFLSLISKRGLLLHLYIFSFIVSTVIFFVTARYRLVCFPILIPFAGFALYWWYEKIKTKSFQCLFLSLMPLIFSVSLTHSIVIEGILYPYIYPKGLYIKKRDGIIIRDHNNVSGEDIHWLQLHFFSMIKKDLVVEEDLSNYKRAFLYIEFIPTDDSDLLMVDINNNKKVEVPLEFYKEKLLSEITLDFDPNLLHKGTNSFVLSVKDSSLSIPVCYSYTFRRSYFWNKRLEWEPLKKGEYMIGLELSR